MYLMIVRIIVDFDNIIVIVINFINIIILNDYIDDYYCLYWYYLFID